MEQEELEKVLDSSWQAFRTHLLRSLDQHRVSYGNEVASKFVNNDSYLFAIDSTDLCKDSFPLGPLTPLSESPPAKLLEATELDTSQQLWEKKMKDEECRAECSMGSSSGAASYKIGASYLESRIAHLSTDQQRAIQRRLRLRLGAISSSKLVSGKSLHEAICALGLTRYGVEEINEVVNDLGAFINLSFKNTKSRSFMGEDFLQEEFHRFGMPAWRWPQQRDSISTIHAFGSDKNKKETRKFDAVPAKALMELLLAVDGDVPRRIFGPSLSTFEAIREVLLAGDTNRLVAELTAVRLNDLAAPPEPLHPLLLVEPVVAILIVANAVMMGFQTDPRYENWEGWIYFEVTFATLLLAEIFCRTRFQGCRKFWCGQEASWNYFDVFLAATGMTDIIMRVALRDTVEFFGVQSVLRLCRLVRLVRIIKAFRLKFMGELRLMVKGWIAGLWTLSLAFTLLFTVIYVISGFATMTIGNSPKTAELGLEAYFRTLPDAMFTSFRCFTGECVDERGFPIHDLLASEFGVIFILGYVVSYMLVSMGIFNVILGVYVEITMKAAKETEANTSEQHARESIRIARVTRELLKKFAAAYRAFQDFDDVDHFTQFGGLEVDNQGGFTDEDLPDDIAITKELFLLVVQERSVQALMDQLDLPANRAQLFDAIDADGSGTLQVAELVQGLLKVRGEVSKSDAVASLLAAKSIQSMVLEMKAELLEQINQFRKDFAAERTAPSVRTSWIPLQLNHAESPRLEEEMPVSIPQSRSPLSTLRAPTKPKILEALDDKPQISPKAILKP